MILSYLQEPLVTLQRLPGSAPLTLIDGETRLLHAEDQVFAAMLQGWRDQQLARSLAAQTIRARETNVRRFYDATNEYPWNWTPGHVDEFCADLVSRPKPMSKSTMRTYQTDLRLFCEYLVDPRYSWTTTCEQLFGAFPTQVCFDWNTASHVTDYEGRPQRRSLTREELQRLLDYTDDRVTEARRLGRKGWIGLMRDATIFKVTYAWGLRRQEVTMLDLEDFGTNPRAPEFSDKGVLYVRYGKSSRGSPPKRRSVLTVFPWSVRVVDQWMNDYRDAFTWASNSSALWPSERAERLAKEAIGARFAEYREAIGLPTEISLHCLRHSYVTHLIEDGWDPRFVQEQVGHEHASTTSLYTSVSSDYRTRTLRKMLDDSIDRALLNTETTGES